MKFGSRSVSRHSESLLRGEQSVFLELLPLACNDREGASTCNDGKGTDFQSFLPSLRAIFKEWANRNIKLFFIILLFTVFIAGFLFNIAKSEAVDDLQFKLQQLYPSQVRWDNIIGQKPYWISHNQGASGGFINIQPEEEVVIRLNHNSCLRIHAENAEITPEMFEVKVSKGSGLYYNTLLSKTNNPHDLLLEAERYPLIIKIKLQKVKSLEKLAFFMSRYVAIPELASYPESISYPGETSRLWSMNINTGGGGSFETYTKLENNKIASVVVKGPARLEILSRYIYSNIDNGERIPYRIKLELDGEFFKEANFIAKPDYNNLYANNSLLSHADVYYIDIPGGNHQLALTANAPLYAQIHWNPALQADASNRANEENKFSHIPSEIKYKSIKLGVDNEWRGAGLESYNLVKNLWEQRKDDHSLENTKEDIIQSFTFFNDLVPVNTNHQKHLSVDWAINYLLADAQSKGWSYKVAANHADHLINQLILGYFIEVPVSKDQKFIYKLPQLEADSELRITAQQLLLKSEQKLYIQYNNNPPTELTLYPARDLDWEEYANNPGLMGLFILENETINASKMATMSGRFTQNHWPGSLYSAGVAVLPLPKNVREIRMWGETNNTSSLKVNLQYRSAHKFRLPPGSIIRESEGISTALSSPGLFINSLKFFDHCHRNNCLTKEDAFFNYLIERQLINIDQIKYKASYAALYNHWLDTIRLLYERYQKFATGMQNVDSTIKLPPAHAVSSVDKLLAKAEELMALKKWNEAAIAWSGILKVADPIIWRKAHIARAEAIKNAGESFLAEKALKAMIIGSRDEKLRIQAYHKLLSIYQQREYYYAIEGLIASYFLHLDQANFEQEEQLAVLSKVLIQDNNQNNAIDIALLLGKKLDDEIVFTLMKRGIAKGEKLKQSIETEEEKHFWQAQRLQNAGLYAEALQEFKLSKHKGEEWYQYLEAALKIKEKLQNKSPEKREKGINEWLQLSYNHPGPKLWQEANYLIEKFYEAVTLYATTRDRYGIYFGASKERPVTLKIAGPAKLQLRIRPYLDDKKVNKQQNIWVVAKMAGKPYFIKIEDDIISDTLKLVGNDKLKVGIEQNFELEIPTGVHEIIIEPTAQAVLIQPFLQRPIFTITALPLVTPQTVNFVANQYWRPETPANKIEKTHFTLVEEIPHINQKDITRTSAKVNYLESLPMGMENQVLQAREEGPHLDLLQKPSLPESLQLAKAMPWRANFLSDNSDVYKTLSSILFGYEKTRNKADLIRGMSLCYKHRGNYNIDQLCNSFEELTTWNPVLSVDGAEEKIFLPNTEIWEPDDVALILRKNLINIDYKKSFIITGTPATILDFTNEEQTQVKLKTELLKMITETPGDVNIGYQIDQGETQKLVIHSKSPEAAQEFAIDKGKHSLRIFLITPKQGTFVKIDLLEKQEKDKEWKSISVQKQKEFFIATHKKPLKLTINGPAWIQAHKVVNNSLTIEDYFIETKSKTITLAPTPLEHKAAYRIFERVPAQLAIAAPPGGFDIDYEEVEANEFELKASQSSFLSRSVYIKDDLPLTNQGDGTWSLAQRFVVASSSDTINAAGKNSAEKGLVKFMEQSATYRYFDDLNRNYYNASLLLREFTNTPPSYGVQLRADHTLLDLPFSIFAKGQMFGQKLNNSFNYSVFSELGINNFVIWSRKLHHNFGLAVAGKHTHFKETAQKDKKFPDPDVYTNYDQHHPSFFHLFYKLNYNPFLDTKLSLEGAYRTNLSLSQSDFVNFKIGIDQYVNSLTVGVDYGARRYYKNKFRLFNFYRHQIEGHIVADHWLSTNNHRIEAKLSVARVFDTDISKNIKTKFGVAPLRAWTGAFGIYWHLGNGRAYRDFRAGEIEFRQLKERSVPNKNEVR